MARERKIKVTFMTLPKKPVGMDKAKWNPGPKQIDIALGHKSVVIKRGVETAVPEWALRFLFKKSKKALAAKNMVPYVPLTKSDIEPPDPLA